jgi:amidase
MFQSLTRIFLFTISLLIVSACSTEEKPKEEAKKSLLALEEISIPELQDAYASGEYTVKEVVQYYIDRIDEIDHAGPELHSVIVVNPDALAIAEELDASLKNGETKGPLFGIPVLLKDNIDTHDQMETTAGSRAMVGSHPLQDSYVAMKLREAGAVILGKTNLSEWANFRGDLSSSGWSGVGGQTKNPYVLDRNPCGSSAGSGVAVSANLCMFAIGTETNGSIVCPSTANGIVGIKPTVGLISRSGIIPISFTQDTPGPMARSVSDAAICLGPMVGVDSSDSKTLLQGDHVFADYTPFLKKDGLKGKRIGLYKKYQGTDYKVDELMEQAISDIESMGAEVIEFESLYDPAVHDFSFELMLFEYKDGLNNYFASLGPDAPIKNLEELIAFNESDSIEMRFYRQEYLIMAQEKGDLNSPEYKNAVEKARSGMQEYGIDKVMDELDLDAIIAPTGSPAWKTDWVNGDFYHIGSSSPAAISGYPNITVPMGFIQELPVGISFFGRAWSEPLLIEIAYSYEQGTMHRKAPQFLLPEEMQ